MNQRAGSSIDPQQRTIVRARDLAAFRAAIVDLALSGPPLSRRRRVVIVPTRASGELLRQTFESDPRGRLLPDLMTRADFFERLQDALPGRPRLASRLEREVLLERAARETAAARTWLNGAPFHLRPGLVAEMLDFYDELRRRQRTVPRFARALFDQLRVERGTDRGSEGLIHQTTFLGLAFLAYQRGLAASGALDEHELRHRLIELQPVLPFDHAIVAVADHPSDPRGLWPADFDLIGRLRTLGRIDVVMTDETHDAGLRERLERELPGIAETRREGLPPAAVIVRPPGREPDSLCFVARDREEELRDVARAIRARADAATGELRGRAAVVFHRPLPYLYLGRQVLTDARIPYQAFDALPLAAEPYAALLDLVLAVARTGGTREAAVGLLRSTMVAFEADGVPISLEDATSLDIALSERRVTGEADSYADEVETYFQSRDSRRPDRRIGALRAARASARMRAELAPFRDGGTGAAQVRAVSAFLRRHERESDAGELWRDRHARARAAVLAVLDELADAFARHDNRARRHEDITAAIHHAVEARTFTPRRGTAGIQLVDAIAARFGEFDHVHLVGLVETDWPERSRRSIFYTTGMLKALGWPQETDQVRAQQAAFRDLLRLARETTSLHAFQLEGDAVVALSPMIDAARDVPAIEAAVPPPRRIFADEILTGLPPAGVPLDPSLALDPETGQWLDLRRRRPGLDDLRYRGFVDPIAPKAYRISRVDRYVDCPFKFFSETVLGLPEERDEAAGLTPLERGLLVHALFERFYLTWQDQGRSTITAATLPDAIALFTELAHEAFSHLPEADRALEETHLLGSIVARGVAERVFELEADAGGEIVKRFLEVDLRGPFTFPRLHGLVQQTIEIRGKADRIDMFRDGSLRVIDYKLGRLPDVETSIQVAVYAHAARQLLEGRDGRVHPVVAAMYLAFGDDRRLEGSLGSRDELPDMAVQARASDFATTVEAIESGRFPARPKRPGDCAWCRYAGVCRKEYLPNDDGTAESV